MSSLAEAIDDFADKGFTEHLGVRGDHLRDLDSGAIFAAHEVVIRGFERFEGVSDPDDMSIVYAIETVDGMQGTLVDAFGVYSNPMISVFVDRVAFRLQERAPGARAREEGTSMKIALIGIGGRVGSRIATELLARGHSVTGIERNPDNVCARAGVAIQQGDATQPSSLAPLIAGHDAVVSASRFETSDASALIAAVKKAGIKRLLVVGGAGSLEVAPGKALIDTPGFPEAYRAEARAGGRFLDTLRKESDLDWTFLSPSAEFAPGDRTGRFRLGGNELLVDAMGKSRISMEDFASAFVDELEHPEHSRQRFTVGY
jgi:putative NADH-flavin reductase